MNILAEKKTEALLEQGKTQEAIAFLNNLLANSYAKIADIHFETYLGSRKKLNKKLLFGNYSKALKLFPQNISYLTRLAWYYYWIGNYNESIAICKKVLEIDSKNLDALNTIGMAYTWGKKDFKKGGILFEKIIKIYPNKTIGYIRLGILFEQKKQFKKALTVYLKALKVDRHDIFVYNLIFKLFDQKYSPAIKKQIAKLAVKAKPDSKLKSCEYLYKGKFYEYLNDHKMAKKIYTSFLNKHKRENDVRKEIEWELGQIIWNEKHQWVPPIYNGPTISKRQKAELVKTWESR